MATDKNKQNTKKGAKSEKSANAKGKKDAKSGKKAPGKSGGIKFEVFGICTIALCLYLLVCIYSESGGPVGTYIKSFLTGMLGICAYALPFVTVILIIKSFINKKSGISNTSKYIMVYVALLVLAALFQLGFRPDDTASQWYNECSKGALGGGFLGGNIVALLSIFGVPGSYIILISSLMILIILIFDISIVELYGRFRDFLNEMSEQRENTEKPQKPEKPEKTGKETNSDDTILPIIWDSCN